MPQIPQYTPEVEASSRGLPQPHASPTGIGTAIAGFGEALQGVGDALYQHQEQTEVADVQTQMAQARAAWTVELEKRANSPHANDPNFADTFSQDFSNAISKIGDNVSTRAGRLAFQQQTAELTSHFAQTAGMYQVAAAGVKAKQDYLTLLDANRNTVLTDPFQFDSVLRSTEAALSDPKGPYANMPPDARDLLARQTRADLALSAAEGAIRMNPNKALTDIQGGKWGAYLDADRTNALMGAATSAINAQEIDASRAERLQEKAQTDGWRANATKIVNDALRDPSTLTATEIANANLSPEQKFTFTNAIKTGLFDNASAGGSTFFVDLFKRVHMPDGNPQKITNPDQLLPYIGNGISVTQYKTLAKEATGAGTPEGKVETKLKAGMLKAVEQQLTYENPLTGIKDPNGKERYQQFLAWALPEYDRERAAGKSPQQLLDPSSKDYIGNLADRLKRPPSEVMRDIMQDNADLYVAHQQPQRRKPDGSPWPVAEDPEHPGVYRYVEPTLLNPRHLGAVSRDWNKIERQAGNLPVVHSPDEAKKLPHGTLFKTPDGRTLVAP